MEQVPDFLRPLEYIRRPFPKDEVKAAIARREESIPHLLRALEWVEQHAAQVVEESEISVLHVYALFLLAQFRETRAYPLVVLLFRNPCAEDLTGDVSTQNLPNILASVCGGDTSLIKGLVEDREVDEFVRGSAVTALGILSFLGMAGPEETSAYFGTLFQGGLEREPNHVWNSLISVCVDLGMTEHLENIRRLYLSDIADPFCQSLEEVETDIMLPRDSPARAYFLKSYRLIDDTVSEMEWWHCFNEPAEEEEPCDPVYPDPYERPLAEMAIPYERESPKIGRNAPCPCGSGKKFKKCCGGA